MDLPVKRQTLALQLATWFGCGYSRFAPGTARSLAALAIGILLHQFAGFTGWHFLVLAGVLFVPATWAATVTSQVTHLKDPQIVVVDEVMGLWISLAGARTLNWKSYLAALALFRLFDIWKTPQRVVRPLLRAEHDLPVDQLLQLSRRPVTRRQHTSPPLIPPNRPLASYVIVNCCGYCCGP